MQKFHKLELIEHICTYTLHIFWIKINAHYLQLMVQFTNSFLYWSWVIATSIWLLEFTLYDALSTFDLMSFSLSQSVDDSIIKQWLHLTDKVVNQTASCNLDISYNKRSYQLKARFVMSDLFDASILRSGDLGRYQVCTQTISHNCLSMHAGELMIEDIEMAQQNQLVTCHPSPSFASISF